MDSVMNEKLYPKTTRKTNILSTKFTDGMVVEESDLTTAQQYPVDLMSTLFKAYFGCGIVCGFNVTMHPEPSGRTDKTKCIKVHPGTAIDCHGYPFRLCEEVIMKFEPKPCPESSEPVTIYIAARRKQEGEQGREISDDKCSSGKPKCKPSRLRDMVVVKSFSENELPDNLCRITADHPADPGDINNESSGHSTACECMKECPCDCCGKSWVLLARIEYIETECSVRCIDKSTRRYVKPIHCHCDAETDGCAEVASVNLDEQDFQTQMAIVADNYSQLSRNISAQQAQLTRWGEDLQKMQQAYFDHQQKLAEDSLEDVKGSQQKNKAAATKKAAKKTARKTPSRRGKK